MDLARVKHINDALVSNNEVHELTELQNSKMVNALDMSQDNLFDELREELDVHIKV